MLKSFLISLRKKPKIVREQIALYAAAGFTGLLFMIWLFVTVPGFFTKSETDESGGLFTDLTEEIVETAPDLSEISEEFREVIATSSTSSSPEVIIPNEYPTTTSDGSQARGQSVRIATTSSQNASGSPENIAN